MNLLAKAIDDADLDGLIAKIYDLGFDNYGSLSITAESQMGLGRRVNRKRVSWLMRQAGLVGVT